MDGTATAKTGAPLYCMFCGTALTAVPQLAPAPRFDELSFACSKCGHSFTQTSTGNPSQK